MRIWNKYWTWARERRYNKDRKPGKLYDEVSTVQYTKLGNSDLNVSRICMGCMGFGNAATGQHSWTLDEAASREIIKRGLELGVRMWWWPPSSLAAPPRRWRRG